MKECLQIVDENDQPIRVATREEAWKNGWILRHSYIVLRDHDGNFLLQQRSLSKKASPGLWTWAATGHVDEGETYEYAARRELQEEMGITTDLKLLDKYRFSTPNDFGTLEAFISLFSGTIDHDTVLTPDPQEVGATKWISATELAERMRDEPEQFTVNMRKSYQHFFVNH